MVDLEQLHRLGRWVEFYLAELLSDIMAVKRCTDCGDRITGDRKKAYGRYINYVPRDVIKFDWNWTMQFDRANHFRGVCEPCRRERRAVNN